MKCKYQRAWLGECGEPTVGRHGEWCEQHIDVMCSCGNKATAECWEASSMVCGYPTDREDGFCHGHARQRGLE